MSLRYREFVREVAYHCPAFEAALLTRTTQRRVVIMQPHRPRAVSLYGLPSTPFTDSVLTSIAWYPAACDVPRPWLHG